MPRLDTVISGILTQYERMIPIHPVPSLPRGAELRSAPATLRAAAPDLPPALVTWQLPGKLERYVFLQKLSRPALVSDDEDLESVDFNKETLVYASSPKLPFQMFPPDFMSWYLELGNAPDIFITGATASVLFRQAAPIEEYVETSARITTFLSQSGGLEK